MIELIGVLAVLAILAVVLVPVLIRQMDRIARENESRDLEELADGYLRFIRRTRTIPDHTTMVPALAAQLGRHTNEVANNRRYRRRAFVIDPGLRIGATTFDTVPYVQTIDGTTVLRNLRLIFLSSIGPNLPAGITNGFAPNTNAFNAIWNAADGAVPTGWVWNGTDGDLRVQRVNLVEPC